MSKSWSAGAPSSSSMTARADRNGEGREGLVLELAELLEPGRACTRSGRVARAWPSFDEAGAPGREGGEMRSPPVD